MSLNKYNAITGELENIASGQRTWVGTRAAYDAAKQAGTLPTNALVCITDDEEDYCHYSTEETKTGNYWIDGKPIYRKVFTGTASNGTTVNHGINNLEKVIDMKGTTTADNSVTYPLSHYDQGYMIRPSVSATQLIWTIASFGTITYIVTLEYTKTTD